MESNNKEESGLKMDGIGETIRKGGEKKQSPFWDSEATALRMVGTTLEKIEKETLWDMGGRFGGLADIPLETGLLPGRMAYAKCLIMFDMDKLIEFYLHEALQGAVNKGYGLDEPTAS